MPDETPRGPGLSHEGRESWFGITKVYTGRRMNKSNVLRVDFWRGMTVVARGKHYYLLQMELRSEFLKP